MANPTAAPGLAPATVRRVLVLLNGLVFPNCVPVVVVLLVLGVLTVGIGWWISLPPTLPGDEIYAAERIAGLTARTMTRLPQMPDAPPESALTHSGIGLSAAGVCLLIVGLLLKYAYRSLCAWLISSARDLQLLVTADQGLRGVAEPASALTLVTLVAHGASKTFSSRLSLPLDAAFLQQTLPRCAGRVRQLLALDHDSDINLDIARRLESLRSTTATEPLESLRLRVDSRAQRLSIGRSGPGEFARLASDVRLTSLPAARCRSLLRDQPPNKMRLQGLPGRPALIIVGLGDIGIELLSQLCAQAQSPSLDPLRIVIVDTAAHGLARDLRDACPALCAVVEITPLALESDMPQFAHVLLSRLNGEGIRPLLIYLALKEEELVDAWERELALVERASGTAPVLVLPASRPIRRAAERSVLAEEEELDTLPRRQHAAYIERAGRPQERTAAAWSDWAHLPFEYQEDNRSSADHLWTTARELDLAIVANSPAQTPIAHGGDIEPLAMAEHRRWHASRALAGWSYGTCRAESSRTHPLLGGWTGLGESDREKDRNIIRDLPAILASAGYGLRRLIPVALSLQQMPPQQARDSIDQAVERVRGEAPAALAHFLLAVETVDHFRLARALAARKDAALSLVLPHSIRGLAVAAGERPEAASALMQASWKVWLTRADAVERVLAGASVAAGVA